jgi:hypothetical protein
MSEKPEQTPRDLMTDLTMRQLTLERHTRNLKMYAQALIVTVLSAELSKLPPEVIEARGKLETAMRAAERFDNGPPKGN